MKIMNHISTGYGIVSQNGKNRENNKNSTKKTNTGRIRVHIGFNAAGTMARIAAANKKTQVAAIERSLRAQLKDAIRYDSDDYTIKAIKRTIGKASFKVKALGKEERMENLRKSAKAAENLRAEAEIRRELVIKRKSRKHKELTDIADTNSVLAKRYNNKCLNKHLGHHIDIRSMEIELSENVQECMTVEDMTAETIDVTL